MSDVFNVCICGLGRIGKIHLANFLKIPNVRILYVVEPNLSCGKETIDSFNLPEHILHHYDDIDRVLADTTLHAVVIGTPTSTHLEVAEKCVRAKKAVLLEKPVATRMKDVIDVYDMVEREKGILLTAFQRNFDEQTEILREKASHMGQVSYMRLCARDSAGTSPPSIEYLKNSGGFFVDSAIHDIDQMLQFVKAVPETVFATGHAHKVLYQKAGDRDQIVIVVKFVNGSIATLDLSRHSTYGYDQRMEIFTLKGMLQSENKRKHSIVQSTDEATAIAPILGGMEDGIDGRYGKAYLREAEYFVKYAQGKVDVDKCLITNKSCLMAHLVAFAAIKSASTNETVIFSDFIPKTSSLLK